MAVTQKEKLKMMIGLLGNGNLNFAKNENERHTGDCWCLRIMEMEEIHGVESYSNS